jgi:hypothetical protein
MIRSRFQRGQFCRHGQRSSRMLVCGWTEHTRGSFGSSDGCGTSSILPVLSYLRVWFCAASCSTCLLLLPSRTRAVPGTCSSFRSSRMPKPMLGAGFRSIVIRSISRSDSRDHVSSYNAHTGRSKDERGRVEWSWLRHERLRRGAMSHRAHASPLQALRSMNLLAQPPSQQGSRLAALDVVSVARPLAFVLDISLYSQLDINKLAARRRRTPLRHVQ